MEKTQQQDDNTLRETIFNLKPYHLLLQLDAVGESYASNLSSECDTTYSHAVKVMNRLESYGLVDSKKKGRKKIYQLTEEGQDLADDLSRIEEQFDSDIRTAEGLSSGSIDKVDL